MWISKKKLDDLERRLASLEKQNQARPVQLKMTREDFDKLIQKYRESQVPLMSK